MAGVGEVLLDVAYCGICGSDLHMLRMTKEQVPAGHVLGHEFTGVIAELGRGVDGWAVGERVVVFPMVACGVCRACCAGHPNLCDRGIECGPGLGRPGAYAEFVAVPHGMLRALPETVSDADGALIEPLAVAIRAIRVSQATPQEPVCVLGGGPIGLLAAAGLRARGFERVAVVELSAGRRVVCERLGIPAVTPDQATNYMASLLGEPPAVVLDCTGHPSGAPLAIELLAPAGRLTVAGLPDRPVPIDLSTVARYELVIRGSVVYREEDFAEALDHIARGRVATDQIITKTASLDAAPALVADLASGDKEQVKVLLRLPDVTRRTIALATTRPSPPHCPRRLPPRRRRRAASACAEMPVDTADRRPATTPLRLKQSCRCGGRFAWNAVASEGRRMSASAPHVDSR